MSVIYTIGYEGTDIDRFVATLKTVGVTVLADVRAVAVSRKKGFSKNGLRERLEAEGITYVHLVELGDPRRAAMLRGRENTTNSGASIPRTSRRPMQLARSRCWITRRAKMLSLVKAMPNPSRKYGETVCCAGVTAEGQWKRLYPIRFRHLQDNKFKRWDWVKFQYRLPTGDTRPESCHVYENLMEVDGALDKKEQVSLLNPLILPSTDEAATRGMSLTLVRPIKSEFKYRRKRPEIIAAEREGYRLASCQMSMLDKELEMRQESFTF